MSSGDREVVVNGESSRGRFAANSCTCFHRSHIIEVPQASQLKQGLLIGMDQGTSRMSCWPECRRATRKKRLFSMSNCAATSVGTREPPTEFRWRAGPENEPVGIAHGGVVLRCRPVNWSPLWPAKYRARFTDTHSGVGLKPAGGSAPLTAIPGTFRGQRQRRPPRRPWLSMSLANAGAFGVLARRRGRRGGGGRCRGRAARRRRGCEDGPGPATLLRCSACW